VSTGPEQDREREPAAEPDWKRKRRLAEIFGDALPETTSDERDPGASSGTSGESASERWLKSQVPPHHGG
jgi:hypothetical protein